MITAEQIYQEYHAKTFYMKNNIYPKAIKNFEKIKTYNIWPYFEKFAQRLTINQHVDYKIMITALASFYKGPFPPNMMLSLKGIRIYNNFVSKMNAVDDEEKITDLVVHNITNVVQYCIDKGFSDFDEYFSENFYLLPTVAMHLSSGFISKFFLALVPNIIARIELMPPDVKITYFDEFIENQKIYKMKALKSKKLYGFAKKFNKNIEKYILKNQKK